MDEQASNHLAYVYLLCNSHAPSHYITPIDEVKAQSLNSGILNRYVRAVMIIHIANTMPVYAAQPA